jgi:hypothetical protein
MDDGKGSRVALRAVLACTALLLVGGCTSLDELLEAELPGQVTDDALNDPALAETLVASAQADFECGLQGHIFGTDAGFANAFQYVLFQVEMIRIANRQTRIIEHGIGECASDRDPIWMIMHRGRTQAADAARRMLEEMPAGEVEDLDLLVGKAYAYEGYATQLLAEAWCEMVFDGTGEITSREDAMARAEDRFTSALDYAGRAVGGERGDEAQDIVDLARVGRARSRLNQGDLPGALVDAQSVTPGFVYYATYENSPTRRNSMAQRLEDDFNVHPRDRGLNINGVPDPRIPIEFLGQHNTTGVGDWVAQRKYPENGTDIPFASWREAQLMIAEIEGGQTAVGIINDLRATVSDLPWVPDGDYNLPVFASNNAQVIMDTLYEERRRELYLTGVKLGDDIRFGKLDTWDTGLSPANAPIGDLTCLPLPEREFL